jgi:hypothetical protein
LSELLNALLRLIAQHGQVELIDDPPSNPASNPPLTPINIQSKPIAIELMMPIDIQSKPIAIAAIMIIRCTFIGHLAIYAGCLNSLIVLWLIMAMATLLFFAIHLIARMSTPKQC